MENALRNEFIEKMKSIEALNVLTKKFIMEIVMKGIEIFKSC